MNTDNYCIARDCRNFGYRVPDGRCFCRAFPSGIPLQILSGRTIHTQMAGNEAGAWVLEPGPKDTRPNDRY